MSNAKITYITALGHGEAVEAEIRALLSIYAPGAEVVFETKPGTPRPTLVLESLKPEDEAKIRKLTVYDIRPQK